MQTTGWTFVPAPDADGVRGGREDGGGTLTIAHAREGAQGSRWEQDITDTPVGKMLRLCARVRAGGTCRRRAGEFWYGNGIGLTLEALGPDRAGEGPARLDVVEQTVQRTPDDAGGQDVCVRLVVPEGAARVRAAVSLHGEGWAQFQDLTVTAEDADAQAMTEQIVGRMSAEGHLRSPEIIRAFRTVRRHHFLPGRNWGEVYQDDAIPTHFRAGTAEAISSSSQPTMMAIMLEQLAVQPGMRVLEIGAGTGYNAALLAQIAGAGDHVWTVDVDADICAEARAHLAAAGVAGVHVVCADGWGGWPDAAPYERIIVTASAHDIAPAWFEQLKDGGLLVLPWGAPNTMQRSLGFRKRGEALAMESNSFCGFMRLRGAHEWGAPEEGAAPPGAQWQHWLHDGQPQAEPTRLIAYPRRPGRSGPVSTAPPLQPGERLVRRTWFDYVVTWG